MALLVQRNLLRWLAQSLHPALSSHPWWQEGLQDWCSLWAIFVEGVLTA